MTHTLFQGRSALRLLPLLSLVLALWACGSISFHTGAVTLKVADVPTAQLRLVIEISDQFSDKPNVLMRTLFFEGPKPQDQVALPAGAHVSCNGTDITPASASSVQPIHTCPRQPPGGSYRITYTDMHSVSTTVLVSVPGGGSFDILSPASGAAVPIPTKGQLEIRYSAPTPPSNGTVTLDNIGAWCLTAQQGCTLSAFPPFSGSSPSGGNVGNAAPTQRSIAAEQTPKPGSTPKPLPTIAPGATVVPGNTPTPPPDPAQGNASASVTVRGGVGTILLRGDFSGFQTGSGRILLEVEGQEMPDHAGFADVSAKFLAGYLSNNIIWTR